MLLPCLRGGRLEAVIGLAFEPAFEDLVGIQRSLHGGIRNRNKKSCNMKQIDASLTLNNKFGNIVREMALLTFDPAEKRH